MTAMRSWIKRKKSGAEVVLRNPFVPAFQKDGCQWNWEIGKTVEWEGIMP